MKYEASKRVGNSDVELGHKSAIREGQFQTCNIGADGKHVGNVIVPDASQSQMSDVWHAPRKKKVVAVVVVLQCREQKAGHLETERVEYLQFSHLRREIHESGMLVYIVIAHVVVVNGNLAQVGEVREYAVADKIQKVCHCFTCRVVCGGPRREVVNDKSDAATPVFKIRLCLLVVEFGFSMQYTEKVIRISGAGDIDVLG